MSPRGPLPNPMRRAWNFSARYLHALGHVAHTFTFGLASPRRRHLISQLARAANFREFPLPELPVISISDLTSEFTSVVLAHPEGSEGAVSLLELLVLARLTRERRPARVFEIGTFHGRTTAVLAANAPEDAIVFTLDLPSDHPTQLAVLRKERAFIDKEAPGAFVRLSPYAHKVRQLLGDSATFDFSAHEADLVFVDGSHAYDYVTNDSLRAVSMLREGKGTVIWHDYGEWEGVTRALNDIARTDARFAGLQHVGDTTLAVLSIR